MENNMEATTNSYGSGLRVVYRGMENEVGAWSMTLSVLRLFKVICFFLNKGLTLSFVNGPSSGEWQNGKETGRHSGFTV